MDISPGLAELNFDRFQDWQRPFPTTGARQAILAFNGDVYMGLDTPGTFNERDYTHAQEKLSDLVRPLRCTASARRDSSVPPRNGQQGSYRAGR